MKLKYFSWIPAAVLMVAIFLFSASTGEESAAQSNLIVDVMLNSYESIQGEAMEEMKREEIYGVLDHFVRKTAHATEYAVLGMCVAFHVIVLGMTGKKRFFLAYFITTAYAITDEVHQLFVPGRSGQVTDVCIDSFGALIGVTILCLIANYVKKRNSFKMNEVPKIG